MDNLNLEWHANIADMHKPSSWEPNAGSLVISGELVNGDVCANNFALDQDELPLVSEQVKEITLRADHSKSIRDVIGGFNFGKYDAEKKRIMFEAEIDDPTIQRLVAKGRLKYISIGATADSFCAECNKPTKPIRTCKCKSHDVIKNIKLKEASIVTEPAYKTSEFKPVGFVASITSALAENQSHAESSEGDTARPSSLNKNMEDKGKMSAETEVKATTVQKAGTDAVVILAEQVKTLAEAVSNIQKRMEAEDAKKAEAVKAEEAKKAEATKKAEEEKKSQEQNAILQKLEEIVKLCKTPPPEKKEDDDDEEEEEDEKKKETQGSKVEDPASKEVKADNVPDWFREIKAYAKDINLIN